MINIAIWFTIPPADYLESMVDWPTHMVIAPHMLSSKKYFQFYVDHPELSTMIDNGLWEGHVVDNQTLLDLAQQIKANEIIAPDDASGYKTLQLTDLFLQFLEERGLRDEFSIQGVVHGKTLSEQVKCLDGLLDLEVDVIGVPKMLGPQNRTAVVDRITLRTDKSIHFLGFYKEEQDLLSGQWCTSIRSFDTSVPFKPDYSKPFNLDLPLSRQHDVMPTVEAFKMLYNTQGGSNFRS